MYPEYDKCRLCARMCGVNRNAGERGFCNVTSELMLARAALHFWEEPPISGTRGSGAVFFSGCSLGCVFCQNHEISRGKSGEIVNDGRLAEIMLELEGKGAHNINLVTPTHYAPTIRAAIIEARSRGLTLPIVYNSSSYDSVDTLKMLSGLVDIYLADFKYLRESSAEKYSHAKNYPDVAMSAIDEMIRQCPHPVLNNGIMERGVIIRILELPSHTAEAKLSLSRLYSKYGDNVYFSLMNQYTPVNNPPYPLNRPLTHEEYRELTDYAERLRVKNAFVQEFGTVGEEFIPDFNGEGVV